MSESIILLFNLINMKVILFSKMSVFLCGIFCLLSLLLSNSVIEKNAGSILLVGRAANPLLIWSTLRKEGGADEH